MSKRVGASSKKEIDPEVLKQLNKGSMETATLSEALAIDFELLLRNVAQNISESDMQKIKDAKDTGITKRMSLAASILSAQLGDNAADRLKIHPSDTVRGWAAFMIGNNTKATLTDKLCAIRPLADDHHFGVREWAWLAMRETIGSELDASLQQLASWVTSESANIRRFAIEVTRPRGVWSRHIPELKRSPEKGRILLDQVMEYDSKYVRDSCGNWLNDAAKSKPEWVMAFCDEWKNRSESASVAYIIKRALRNVTGEPKKSNQKGNP